MAINNKKVLEAVLAGEIKNPYMEVVPAYFLREAPAVDAVKVVRCGDCKHYFRPEYKDRGYCDFDDGLCGTVKNDSFCCYGERRGDK